MKSPLITVIVPVYNTEQYVACCLESVLAQTYPHFELIVVNDGSTDGGLKICEKYAACDDRIRLFSQENRGLGMTRNVGLDHMRGAYVVFLDSDDTLEPNALEILVEYAQNYQTDAVFFGTCFDTGFRRVKRATFSSPTVLQGIRSMLWEYIVTKRISPCAWDKMYKAEVFRELRYSSIRRNEDAFILPELLSKIETAVCIEDPLYIQRIRDGSLERSGFSETALAQLECEKELRCWVQKLCPDLMGVIAYRMTNTIAVLMGTILAEFRYFRFSEIYQDLKKQLHEEYLRAQEHVTEESVLLGTARLALNAPVVFAVKQFARGIKRAAKHFIKKILLRGKRFLNGWKGRS